MEKVSVRRRSRNGCCMGWLLTGLTYLNENKKLEVV